ncbi:hypothetical protein LCGC14_0468960 [marine sediment metagenome]|uniref:Uncharacterized protein n=1 Tax=marine sediment metagenome TaxID=412755 RepID=A0A0F9SCU8_9ZZZZ
MNSELVDNLLGNPDVSRVLCIAIAAEARRLGDEAAIDTKDLAMRFSRLVRSLDRKAFTDECRQLERLGPERYLQAASKLLK